MKKPATAGAAGNPEGYHRRRSTSLLRALCLALALPGALAAAQSCPQDARATDDSLVIIIDDLGNHLARGREALALPGALTYAVIPFTRHGEALARTAGQQGREVMVHAPMSNLEGTPLGRGGLTAELTREEFRTRLRAALQSLPMARGLNNHMGSELTQLRPQMAWLMQELRWRDMYFVDSRTSDRTVAATVAQEFRVPHLSRQVFLDNERDPKKIAARFEEALARARDEGVAVAIGHPYPETIAFLREALPAMAEEGVRLARVSDVLQAGVAAVGSCDAIGKGVPSQQTLREDTRAASPNRLAGPARQTAR